MQTACAYLMKAAVLCYSFVGFAGELAELASEMLQDEDFGKVMSIVNDPGPITLSEDDYLECCQEIVHSLAGKLDDQSVSQKALFDVCVDNVNRYDFSSVNETEAMMKIRFKVDTAVTLFLMDHAALKKAVNRVLNYAQQRVIQRKYGSAEMLSITTIN